MVNNNEASGRDGLYFVHPSIEASVLLHARARPSGSWDETNRPIASSFPPSGAHF
jgi:hypothetical protein